MKAAKVIASVPPGHCLGALEMHKEKFTISSLCTFKEKMPWCPFPFKNDEYRPEKDKSPVNDSAKYSVC